VKNDVEIKNEMKIDSEIDDKTKIQLVDIPDVEVVDEPDIFTVVEEMPSFPGGEEALFQYLAEAIKYPPLARDAGIKGKVYVSFVVKEDGSVKDVKVLRGIGGGCDEEALRVVHKMPRWNPGRQRGKAVSVQYTLHLRFVLK
jgi:protein TonB